MATMSYCAFENTDINMRVAVQKLEDLVDDGEQVSELDTHEKLALRRLVEKAKRLVELYEVAIDGDNDELLETEGGF